MERSRVDRLSWKRSKGKEGVARDERQKRGGEEGENWDGGKEGRKGGVQVKLGWRKERGGGETEMGERTGGVKLRWWKGREGRNWDGGKEGGFSWDRVKEGRDGYGNIGGWKHVGVKKALKFHDY